MLLSLSLQLCFPGFGAPEFLCLLYVKFRKAQHRGHEGTDRTTEKSSLLSQSPIPVLLRALCVLSVNLYSSMRSVFIRQRLDARQLAPAQKFERCSSAGRDVRNFIGKPFRVYCCDGISAANN